MSTQPPLPPEDESVEQAEPAFSANMGAPTVAAAPRRVFLVLGLLVFFIIMVIVIVSSGSKDKSEEQAKKEKSGKVVKATPIREDTPPPPPAPPVAPPAIEVAPPPAPPPAESLFGDDDHKIARQKRLRSDMISFGGKSGTSEAKNLFSKGNGTASKDENSGFADSVTSESAPEQTAKIIKDTGATIAQGKIIIATLETALDTQLPGMVRAVVSRDIYAEQGKERLIPKGSRLVGNYNSLITRGQNRVFIIWTRVIRPDGVNIMVNSPGVDALGRAGLSGYLDNKYAETFSSAIMTSIVSLGVAAAADAVVGDTTVTSNSNGSTTTSGSAGATSAASAIDSVGSAGRRIMDDISNVKPHITVDQGTPVNVMVNRDLIFPQAFLTRTNVIQ